MQALCICNAMENVEASLYYLSITGLAFKRRQEPRAPGSDDGVAPPAVSLPRPPPSLPARRRADSCGAAAVPSLPPPHLRVAPLPPSGETDRLAAVHPLVCRTLGEEASPQLHSEEDRGGAVQARSECINLMCSECCYLRYDACGAV